MLMTKALTMQANSVNRQSLASTNVLDKEIHLVLISHVFINDDLAEVIWVNVYTNEYTKQKSQIPLANSATHYQGSNIHANTKRYKPELQNLQERTKTINGSDTDP